jgi:hypothetical protein
MVETLCRQSAIKAWKATTEGATTITVSRMASVMFVSSVISREE